MSKRALVLAAITSAAGVVAAIYLTHRERSSPAAQQSASSYSASAEKNARGGQITAAVIDYNRGIAVSPRDPKPYIGLAVLYEALNRSDLAIDALEALRAANPEAEHLGCRLAEAHLGVEDVPAAREYGERAVTKEPNCPRAFSNYGIALARMRYWDSAGSALERALKLAPGDSQITGVLMDVRMQQGRFADAVALGEQMLLKNSQSARLEYKLGFAYARAVQLPGARDKAIQHLSRAAEISPKWFEPRAELGRIYKTVENLSLAVDAFEKAWALDDHVPGVAFNLAEIYRRQKNPRAAVFDTRFKEMLKSKEKFTALRRDYNQESTDRIKTIALAKEEGRKGMFGPALHRLRKRLARDPADLDALTLFVTLDLQARSGNPDYLRPSPGLRPPEL